MTIATTGSAVLNPIGKQQLLSLKAQPGTENKIAEKYGGSLYKSCTDSKRGQQSGAGLKSTLCITLCCFLFLISLRFRFAHFWFHLLYCIFTLLSITRFLSLPQIFTFDILTRPFVSVTLGFISTVFPILKVSFILCEVLKIEGRKPGKLRKVR